MTIAEGRDFSAVRASRARTRAWHHVGRWSYRPDAVLFDLDGTLFDELIPRLAP